MTLPSVAIIIVNWNGKEFLGDCLTAVQSLDYPRERYHALVVDNCSTDGSVDFVRANFAAIQLHQHDVNNYARANNFGVRTTTTKYVAFLNSDTRVQPPWLRELVEVLEAHPRAGAAGSKVVFPDGRLNSTGLDFLPGFHFRDRGFGEADRDQYAFGEVVGLSGCSVLLRRTALREVGLLDEDFEMYYEDVDLSFRMRAGGWSLLYVPRSVVHHLYNASIKKSPQRTKDFFGERNRLFLIARHRRAALPASLMRSRAIIEAKAAMFKQTLPVVLKKWIEAGADPASADALYQAALGAKIEIARFRRAHKAMDGVIEVARQERDEARRQYGAKAAEAESARDAARQAFTAEQQQRRERERWLRIIMTELKMRRVRELDESEKRFLEAMEREDEKQMQTNLAASTSDGGQQPAAVPPAPGTPRAS